MPDFYQLTRPLLFRIDPERAHSMTIKAMKAGLSPPGKTLKDPILEQTIWGLRFPNPLGMAAGFDKNAEVIGPTFGLGFGFVEAGTVTPKPQHGNPKPRLFRDPVNEAVINRMGFSGHGMNAFKANLEKFLAGKTSGGSSRPPGVIGINIGMNKSQKDPAKDYGVLIRMLGPMADYLTINISSPNTPGLRDLQAKEPLTELLGAMMEERKKSCGNHPPPLLVKLAPDMEEEQRGEIAATLLNAKVDGIILTNTTLARPEGLPARFASQPGGLSGKPLKDMSTQAIKSFYRLTKGKIPIIGVGGISSGRDAYDKIKAGASLLQLYSALVFKGPTVAHSINEELLMLLKADGHGNIADAIGTGVGLNKKSSKAANGS
ncbi:MAG: dihydroorotate dehydrogenase (quinone) [Micavibrio sp.]|nr:MAG: dihydroorotate dehydrogenase (quinone) [Micavibrio sp.]